MKYDVGDLVQDITFPEDGMALVLERNRKGYKMFSLQTGRADWFEQSYVEEECEKVEITNEQNSQQSNQSHAG